MRQVFGTLVSFGAFDTNGRIARRADGDRDVLAGAHAQDETGGRILKDFSRMPATFLVTCVSLSFTSWKPDAGFFGIELLEAPRQRPVTHPQPMLA